MKSDERSLFDHPVLEFMELEEIQNEQVKMLGQKSAQALSGSANVIGYSMMKAELLAPMGESSYWEWVNFAWLSMVEGFREIGKVYPMEITQKEKENHLLKYLPTRNISVALESIHFNFYLKNIPRSVTHQIVRHRKMAFGQQSLRAADASYSPFVIPAGINKSRDVEKMKELFQDCKKMYTHLINIGVPREQARGVLPSNIATTITMTTDLRGLVDYLKNRLAYWTQYEHRVLAWKIAEEIKIHQPKFYRLIKLMVEG